jgi:hypothetical protein
MTVISFAIVLALCWLILVFVAHVSAWFIHLLIIAAFIALVVWLLDSRRPPRTRA